MSNCINKCSIISFARYGKDRGNHLVGVFNYTPQTFSDYKMGLPDNCCYRKLFCSDNKKFGGSDVGKERVYNPIDSPYADFKDLKGLKAAAAESSADGFAGMLAIHPDQVPVINAAFLPDAGQVAEARAIVDLFAANPGAGAMALDGKMVEQPHLLRARRLLERAG